MFCLYVWTWYACPFLNPTKLDRHKSFNEANRDNRVVVRGATLGSNQSQSRISPTWYKWTNERLYINEGPKVKDDKIVLRGEGVGKVQKKWRRGGVGREKVG